MASISSLHPRRAVSYYKGRHSGNEIPAILWLFIAVSLVVVIRNQALPSPSQMITFLLAGGVIVGVGAFAPDFVVIGLVALLIAGILDVPGIGPFLASVQGRVSSLTGAP